MSNSTVYTNQQTVIAAPWLNDVNNFVYNGTVPTGSGFTSSSVPFTPTLSGSVLTSVGVDLNNQLVNVQRFGGGTGVADNTSAINAGISSLSAAGGGILFFPLGTYNHAGSIIQASNVKMLGYGATLAYSGSGVQVTSPTTGFLNKAGIEGLILNAGASATKCLELYSPFKCHFSHVTVVSTSLTIIAEDILTNSTGPTNPAGNYNPAYNYTENLLVQGTCGTGVRITGGATGPNPATLNMWLNLEIQNAAVMGINFVQWCDSNFFAGLTRIGLNVASSAIGVTFNSGSPTANVGVYSNNFDHLAIDTFAGFSGRVGIQMNFTKLCNIRYFFNDPAAEGGPFLTTANTQSYTVLHQVAGTGNMIMRNQLTTFNGADQPIFTVGSGGDISTQGVGIVAGATRTGSGIAYLDLIGDTTFTTFGTQLIRQAGPNGNTNLNHRGTGGVIIQPQDSGSFVEIQDSTGTKGILVNNTGIGVLSQTGSPSPQSTGWGTPTGGTVVSNFPGASATLAQTSGVVAQIIAVLKAFGWMGT